jgi:hypothetical protein
MGSSRKLSKRPPIPEDVQRTSRERVRPYRVSGVFLVLVGVVFAACGLVGVVGGAIEVVSWALLIIGLACLVNAKWLPRLLDTRPYGSSRSRPPTI